MADAESNPMRVDTSLLQGITAANSAAVKAKSSSLTSTSSIDSSPVPDPTDKQRPSDDDPEAD